MFSIRDAFGTGYKVFKDNAGILIAVHLTAIAIQFVPQVLPGESAGVKALVVIGCLLLSFVVALGLVRIGLNLVDGLDVTFADLFSCAYLVFGYLVASLLHGFLIVFGLILLVFPGLYWGAQFLLWPYLMVEHEMGPIAAMKESSRLTRGQRGKLILFYLASFAAILLGVCALLVGVVVAYAVITVAGAYVYRRILEGQPEEAEAVT